MYLTTATITPILVAELFMYHTMVTWIAFLVAFYDFICSSVVSWALQLVDVIPDLVRYYDCGWGQHDKGAARG